MYDRYVRIKLEAFNEVSYLKESQFNASGVYPVFAVTKDRIILSNPSNGQLVELYAKYLVDVTSDVISGYLEVG